MLARQLEQRGRRQMACRLYQGALQRMPESDRRSRSQAYYRAGECLWSLGQAGDAFEDFQRAIDVDATNSKARLRLGEILLASGALDRAAEQALALLEGGRGDPEALALLGAASSGSGQTEIAEAAFRKVLEADPGRVNIAIALADIYNRQDRTADARAVLQKAAQSQPGSASPLLALARLEEQEGNSAAAERAYRDAVAREGTPHTSLRLAQFLERSGRVTEAQSLLRQVDRMQLSLPTALPDFELLAGKPGDALEGYLSTIHSKAITGSNSSEMAGEAASRRAALAARIIEADLQLAQGTAEPAKATVAARLHLAAYRSDLDPATIAVLQTEMALAEGDVASAESQGRMAVEMAPESAASHYVLGLAKFRSGQNSEAKDSWLKALDHDADFVPARLELTRELLQSGDVHGAEEYIVPAVRDEPGNLHALSLYSRVLLRQGRLSSVQVIANRAAAIDDTAAFPHVLLAQIAERRKQYAEALIQFGRALLLDPRSPDAIQGLVRLYRRGTITRPMLAKIEHSATTNPQSAALLEIAGRLYAEHGWNADAIRCLRRTLSMDPQRRSAAAALAQLLAQRGDLAAAAHSVAGASGRNSALLLGLAAQQQNRTGEAIAQYEIALRGGEHSGVAANNLAWLYAQQGTSLDRALALAEQARALAPKDPAVLDTVGVVRLRRREYTEAIVALRDAAALASAPGSPAGPKLSVEIRSHLSEAYLRAGMPQQAAYIRTASARNLANLMASPLPANSE